VLLLATSLVLAGCRPDHRKRPYGFLNLGPLSQLVRAPETINNEQRVLVRFDGKGFSAMSLDCTFDLTRVEKVEKNGRTILLAKENGSEYDERGHVLKGPARANLPYYELAFGGVGANLTPTNLYVHIGYEKPEDWRLYIPTSK
jgi:hypothetical protein